MATIDEASDGNHSPQRASSMKSDTQRPSVGIDQLPNARLTIDRVTVSGGRASRGAGGRKSKGGHAGAFREAVEGNPCSLREVLDVARELLRLQEVRLCAAMLDELCDWHALADASVGTSLQEVWHRLGAFAEARRQSADECGLTFLGRLSHGQLPAGSMSHKLTSTIDGIANPVPSQSSPSSRRSSTRTHGSKSSPARISSHQPHGRSANDRPINQVVVPEEQGKPSSSSDAALGAAFMSFNEAESGGESVPFAPAEVVSDPPRPSISDCPPHATTLTGPLRANLAISPTSQSRTNGQTETQSAAVSKTDQKPLMASTSNDLEEEQDTIRPLDTIPRGPELRVSYEEEDDHDAASVPRKVQIMADASTSLPIGTGSCTSGQNDEFYSSDDDSDLEVDHEYSWLEHDGPLTGSQELILNKSANKTANLVSKKSRLSTFESVLERDTRLIGTSNYPWIMHPSCTGRMVWDVLSLFIIIAEAVVVPLAIGFDVQADEVWYWFTTVWFMLDLISHFCTGYFKNGILVMQQRLIARHYMSSYFVIDLCATLPWELILAGSDDDAAESASLVRFARAGKMMRMLRLLRVVKVKELTARFEEMFASYTLTVFLQLLKMVLCFSVLCHWSACLWGFLGVPAKVGHPTANLQPHDLDGCEPGGPCEGGVEGSPWIRRYGLEKLATGVQYLISLHFAAGLLTGSEMELQAGYSGERVFIVLMMPISILFCSVLISQIVVMGQKLGKNQAELTDRLRKAKQFMASRKVPNTLQVKVKRYLEYQHKSQQQKPPDSGFMERLSPWLRLELVEHMNRNVIMRHPFFQELPALMLKRVCGMARTVLCAPGDVVVQRGHRASSMCHIIRGRLKILRGKAPKVNKEVSQGDTTFQEVLRALYIESPSWIGDLCLFQEMVRTNTVVSMTHSELLTIAKDGLIDLLGEFPKAHKTYDLYCQKVVTGDLEAAGIKCGYCGSPGHNVGDCPVLRRVQGGPSGAMEIQSKSKTLKALKSMASGVQNVGQGVSHGIGRIKAKAVEFQSGTAQTVVVQAGPSPTSSAQPKVTLA